MIDKLAEELFAAAVTDIGFSLEAEPTGVFGGHWIWRALDGRKNLMVSMSTAQCCRTHTLFEKKATGKTAASTWCQLSWCLNLVPKLSGAKMISYKLTEYQRIMS